MTVSVQSLSAFDQLADRILWLIADMRAEAVLGDHVPHIAQDFRSGGDGRRCPGLEAIAERMQVTVGADAGIAMGVPGAAETVLGFQNQKTRVRILLGEVISGADAGDPGADDDDIDMFGGVFDGWICGDLSLDVHGLPIFFGSRAWCADAFMRRSPV